MIRRIVYIFLLFILIMGCAVQDNSGVRGFNAEEIAEYNNSERFNYDRVIVAKQNVVLDFFIKVLIAVGRFLDSVFGIIIIAFLIILMVWLLLVQVRKDRNTSVNDDLVFKKIDEVNVENIEFETLIKNALDKGDYRIAVRFRFLHLLKHLSKHNLISIREGKTNYEYYYELPGNAKVPYQSILQLFEYVWYGHFPTSRMVYQKMEKETNDLIGLTTRANA